MIAKSKGAAFSKFFCKGNKKSNFSLNFFLFNQANQNAIIYWVRQEAVELDSRCTFAFIMMGSHSHWDIKKKAFRKGQVNKLNFLTNQQSLLAKATKKANQFNQFFYNDC